MKSWKRHCSAIQKRREKSRITKSQLDDAIKVFVETCSDHQLVDQDHVNNWVKQFKSQDKVIPYKILSELRYYSGAVVQTLSDEFIDRVFKRYGNIPNDIYFIPIGGAGSGSQSIARAIIRSNKVREENVIDVYELHATKKDELANKILVFLDDFSGSGRTIIEWWENVEPLILPLNATISIGVLVLNYKAIRAINDLKHYLFFIEYLNEEMDMFSSKSDIFIESEKEILLRYCMSTGCPKNMFRGFDDCGLLIGFQHGCPNNSLPLLWYSRKEWKNLFYRRNLG